MRRTARYSVMVRTSADWTPRLDRLAEVFESEGMPMSRAAVIRYVLAAGMRYYEHEYKLKPLPVRPA